jgi:hypothetical protein
MPRSLLFAAACAVLLCTPLQAREAPTSLPAHGVIGIEDRHLDPEFWVRQLARPDAVLLDRAAIEARNADLLARDPTMHDLRALPATLSGEQVRGWITDLSQRPDNPLFDVEGRAVPAGTLDGIMASLALDAIPASQPTRYGLVVHRADLRTFPTALRVFSRAGETDIDRFQESALFPGDPVAVAHQSADGEWLFVVSPRYAAWIEAAHVAIGDRDQVLGYGERTPYRIVTGGEVETVFTREQPAHSELSLDMGLRLPLADVPPDRPVNGQHPYTSWVLDLPLRNADGSLAFAPALLPKREETGTDYLPLTEANLIRQAFKFLGERYGWGHSYNGRDCSGFVSEVYRSMGVQLPRNTRDQSKSPALAHTLFGDGDAAARAEAVKGLQVGDLVYIPGHVMMVIGHVDGQPYVIHDTNGGSMPGPDGKVRSLKLNAVSVTPLLPLMFNDRERYVDRITSIVRLRGR